MDNERAQQTDARRASEKYPGARERGSAPRNRAVKNDGVKPNTTQPAHLTDNAPKAQSPPSAGTNRNTNVTRRGAGALDGIAYSPAPIGSARPKGAGGYAFGAPPRPAAEHPRSVEGSAVPRGPHEMACSVYTRGVENYIFGSLCVSTEREEATRRFQTYELFPKFYTPPPLPPPPAPKAKDVIRVKIVIQPGIHIQRRRCLFG